MLDKNFDTQQIHGGFKSDTYGACSVPTYTTAAYKFHSVADSSDRFHMRIPGHVYSRIHNPTVDVFEVRMSMLEGGVSTVASSSGAAAIMMLALALCKPGNNFISASALFHGTYHQFHGELPRLGIDVRFATSDDASAVGSLVDANTKFIFTESISNPRGHVADLETLASVGKQAGIPLVVDNTFGAGGYFIRPFDFGADIIIHSASKWICGHGTTLGGAVVDSGKFDWSAQSHKFPIISELQKTYGISALTVHLRGEGLTNYGGCLSPTSAQQLLIGLETLSVRCERMANNAKALARWLEAHPQVAWVAHPSLESHESYHNAKKYLRHPGGSVIAFELKGHSKLSHVLIDNLKLTSHCANVGDCKTLAIHLWEICNRLDDASRAYCGLSAGLVRISVGIEAIDDIINDFESGLKAVNETLALEEASTRAKNEALALEGSSRKADPQAPDSLSKLVALVKTEEIPAENVRHVTALA